MVPGVVQIEPVLPVRAPAVNREPSRQATDGEQPAPSTQASGVAVQAAISAALVQNAPRSVPVTDDREIRLTVKSDTHEVIATLVNTQTNEVIREIPPAEMRKASEVIRALLGQSVDKLV